MMLGVLGMYYTANATFIYAWIGALHPVIAVFLLIISYQLLRKIMKVLFNKRKGEH